MFARFMLSLMLSLPFLCFGLLSIDSKLMLTLGVCCFWLMWLFSQTILYQIDLEEYISHSVGKRYWQLTPFERELWRNYVSYIRLPHGNCDCPFKECIWARDES